MPSWPGSAAILPAGTPNPLLSQAASATARGPSWAPAAPSASEVCAGWRGCTRRTPPQQRPTWTSKRVTNGRAGGTSSWDCTATRSSASSRLAPHRLGLGEERVPVLQPVGLQLGDAQRQSAEHHCGHDPHQPGLAGHADPDPRPQAPRRVTRVVQLSCARPGGRSIGRRGSGGCSRAATPTPASARRSPTWTSTSGRAEATPASRHVPSKGCYELVREEGS
jgi:hypothetical protein